MNKYIIEKAIPFPEKHENKQERFPLLQMEVGDSFKFDGTVLTSIRSAFYRLENKIGKKFTALEIEPGIYRAWRIK